MGMDLYHPVTSDYAKDNNKFTGKINKITLDLKASTSSEADATKSKVATAT